MNVKPTHCPVCALNISKHISANKYTQEITGLVEYHCKNDCYSIAFDTYSNNNEEFVYSERFKIAENAYLDKYAFQMYCSLTKDGVKVYTFDYDFDIKDKLQRDNALKKFNMWKVFQ